MVYFHAGFALASVGVFSAGVATALFMRKKKWWLKAHKALGIMGSLLLGTAVLGAVIMVQSWQGDHFNSPHGYLGMALVPLAALTVTQGFLQFRVRARRPLLRLLHRVSGFAVLLLMILNALGGLSKVGLFS